MQTLDKGGTVYGLSQSKMPGDALALAVLRYSPAWMRRIKRLTGLLPVSRFSFR